MTAVFAASLLHVAFHAVLNEHYFSELNFFFAHNTLSLVCIQPSFQLKTVKTKAFSIEMTSLHFTFSRLMRKSL